MAKSFFKVYHKYRAFFIKPCNPLWLILQKAACLFFSVVGDAEGYVSEIVLPGDFNDQFLRGHLNILTQRER